MAGLAAQAVVAVHLAYLLYAVVGGLLGLLGVRWLWPHLCTALWGLVGLLTEVTCPLTQLEKHLLAVQGQEPYAGTFIRHYLDGVLYPAAWHDLVWWGTAVFVLGSYALVAVHHAHDGADRAVLTSRPAAVAPRGSLPRTAPRPSPGRETPPGSGPRRRCTPSGPR